MSRNRPPTSPHQPENDPFAPEVVDEQIAARLGSTGQAEPEVETRLVRALAAAYPLPAASEQVLARVRQRLREAEVPPAAPSDTRPTAQPPLWREHDFGAPNEPPLTRGRGIWASIAAIIIVSLLVGAFARLLSTRGPASPSPTPTPSTSLTTPTTTSLSIVANPCQPKSLVSAEAVRVGDVYISLPGRPVDNPYALLPSGVPDAPYQVPADAINTLFQPNPPVNPNLGFGSGYTIEVCNQTSKPHVLSSLSVTITHFSPSTAAIREWTADGVYNTALGQAIGTGTFDLFHDDFLNDYLQATFPSDASGVTVPVQHATGVSGITSAVDRDLPLTIQPNSAFILAVSIDGLTSEGTYTLAFNVSIDGGASTAVAPANGSFVIASNAVPWTGKNCEVPAMRAQIPPATEPTYYVCPPA